MRLSRFPPLPILLGFLALVAAAPTLSGCDGTGNCDVTTPFSFENISPEGTELGTAVASGDCVSIDYVGRRAVDDSVFARGTDRAFFFPNGLQGVVTGFVLGMAGQRVGETRLVTVPPDRSIGYGNFENPPLAEGLVGIPACSVVEFEIKLRAIYQDSRPCQ